MRREEPAEVTTGWNGVAALEWTGSSQSAHSVHRPHGLGVRRHRTRMRLRTAPKWARVYANLQVNVAIVSLRREEPFELATASWFSTQIELFILETSYAPIRPGEQPPGVPRRHAVEPECFTIARVVRPCLPAFFGGNAYLKIESIICLLETTGGELDLGVVCVLAWDAIGLYDDMRDPRLMRQRTMEIWPYFSHDPVAVATLRREELVEVAACWSSAVVFDAN
ncbi:hypothetical protein DFH06DRAFT_1344527 [Mycena polygramma]|nr:hypothetical protein DFH06DRAFT_1344527 [Mycena polygramma]